MSIAGLLLIVVILMLIGAVPAWPHSRNWGYAPSAWLKFGRGGAYRAIASGLTIK